jgi:alanine-synthesizing transaminase
VFSARSSFDAKPNALTLALEARRARGLPVLDLTGANPTTAGIPYARDAILAALGDPRALVYEPMPFGLPTAREAVARELGIDASRVVLTASTSEAYAFVFKLLCDPGDEVLVPQPSYPLFDLLAAYESVSLVPYRLAYDGRWHVDLDSVRRARTSRTRAILCVTPNNPTGSYLDRAELAAFAATGLPIVSDEVFAPYALRDDAAGARMTTVLETGTAGESGPLVFALGGLSKMAALPQMKLGWLVAGGPRVLVDAALARLELIADTFLSVGTPVQHAAPVLLASSVCARVAIRTRTQRNLAALRAAVDHASALSILDVEGGWYATLRLPRTQREEAWALELLAEDGVYVHPGHFFDFADEAYAIVSLLTPEADFVEGAERIMRRVAKSLG